MPLDAAIAQQAKDRYFRELDRYLKLAQLVHSECSSLVRDNHIPATVQSRAKDPNSFFGKLMRYIQKGDPQKLMLMGDVDGVFRTIGDLAAVRVATYVEADRERVVELIARHFGPVPRSGCIEIERKQKEAGYRATHCQVSLPPELAGNSAYLNISDLTCEIQVCSMMAHVWNEIEHDLRYKGHVIDSTSPFEGRLLDNLLDKTIEGDELIGQMLNERSRRVAEQMKSPVTDLFSDVEHFDANLTEVLQEAVRLGYDSPARLLNELLKEDYVRRGQELLEQANESLRTMESSLCLDEASADVLLVLLLERHLVDMRALHSRELESGGARRPARIADALVRAKRVASNATIDSDMRLSAAS